MKKKELSSDSYAQMVPAVEQACKILIFLAKESGARPRLTDICKEVGIHNSKGYSILNTLMRFGLIQKETLSKTYSLGPGLAYLGSKAMEGMDLGAVVEPFLKALSNETGETSLFGMLSGEQVFIISKQEGSQPIGVNIALGHRFHMTAGAHGKAIVSALGPKQREEVLSRKKLYFYGDPLRFQKRRFEREMREIKKRGFAEDRGDLQHGINAVSSAVMGPSGNVVGSVILIGTFPEKEIARFGPLVAHTAKKISSQLSFGLNAS
ncbi:MAG TPA: IclR family transcriptional regulator [Desulfobacterales bacterium]|nr:IclR family transcriptional regulator [Desulfobacterales bacterium]